MRAGWAISLATALVAVPATGYANEATVLLIRGDVPEALRTTAEQLLSYVPTINPTELRPGPAAAATKCGTEVACVRNALGSTDVALAVVIAATPVDGQLGTAVVIVDLRAGRSIAKQFERVDLESTSLTRGVRALLVNALREAGHELGGRVQITVEPSEATITLGERSVPGSFDALLPTGRVVLRADASGHETREIPVEVRAGETTSMTVSLDESSILDSPWLWIGAGAVVVGATAAIVVLARPEPTTQLCQGMCP